MRPTRSHALQSLGWRALLVASAATLALPRTAAAQAPNPTVRVVADAAGTRLQVGGRDFMVLGMNWDYVPIGQNYGYSLWTQKDDIIIDALEAEMPLLKAMGVNALRQYAGIPPRWVKYIYEKYGIWTVVNHSVGRYGNSANGAYVAQTDYSNPKVRQVLTAEVMALVDEFKGTPGMLMWLLGNENNYGLEWKSAETEALPVGERNAAKARYLYSLMGEITRAIKARDGSRPVAIANGDLQYIDIIAAETKGLDVFGTNMYRGMSFGDAFQVVKDKLGIPMMFTEFGADAYNARENREDQLMQVKYLLSQWREIYLQSSGKGQVGNAIGGFTFQWSDGWWKFGQETRLDQHDANASWPNEAYREDFTRGENNMNEEWWGIMAKGAPDSRGLFPLYPRAAYYGLQRAYTLDPYAPTTTAATIATHFGAINTTELAMRSRADKAAMGGDGVGGVRVSGMRLELSTFNTGGEYVTTPTAPVPNSLTQPAFRGFDRLESYFVGIEAKPTNNFTANVSVNILGNVPTNPIDQIFYENRGLVRTIDTPNGPLQMQGIDRLRIYSASFTWEDKNFRLEGFNRTGHYHWGYEGDFFGLYREANYGRNIDIYNGDAPLGMEFTGKKALDGLKVAVGPQLWWGANPTAIAKYRKKVGELDMTAMYQEDISQFDPNTTTSSFAIPVPKARRATFAVATNVAGVGVELGGMWSGGSRIGQPFQIATGTTGNYQLFQDRVKAEDGLGAKAKLTWQKGRWNWYAQGAVMGLVADGGPTSVQTFTGWSLRETGLNNQVSALTGLAVNVGNWQVAPNVLWQKPIVGPVPFDVQAPGRPRNILSDPFSVRGNRETMAGELLLTYDPTPATWMYQWDNDMREDARLAGSLSYVYKHLPTTMDAAIGILGDGRTLFAFPGATPARELWEVRGRIVTRPTDDLRMIVNFYGGTAEPNGNSQRLVKRYGGDLRLVTGQFKLVGSAKYNDFGPYDYHRDFNLTFPTQFMADVSYSLAKPQWWDIPETKFGLRGTLRSLDRYSPRFCPFPSTDPAGVTTCDVNAPGAPIGREWEIRSYLMVAW